MARISRVDWLEAGLRALSEHGEDGIRIDRLCDELGVTKGSFHHHFGGIGVYREALLDAHVQAELDLVAALRTESGETEPVDTLRALPSAVSGAHDLARERAVRAWAAHDPTARDAQRRIDEGRLALLVDLWSRVVPDPAAARTAALVPYLIGVGSEVTDAVDADDLDAVYALLAVLAPHVAPRP
ncbi:MAG: TetR/AcrR family transcriptional regulator [Microbacterium sp.]